MKAMSWMWWVCLGLLTPAMAQNGKEVATDRPKGSVVTEDSGAPKVARAKASMSEAGRAALAAAKEVAGRGRALHGPDRSHALELAASAYDKVVADFQAEPPVAAAGAFAGAELWRQQGSLALAEKDYLLAATMDAPRFAQRALLGAADMQRREKRFDEAMATYAKAAAIDPGSARAQDARLWQARLLQTAERLDEAIVAFQAALESAVAGSQAIEAANYLALAWIQQGNLEAAGRAIDHAEQSVTEIGEEDPIVIERLHKSLEAMSARKALQRARDKQNGAAKDAVRLEAARRQQDG